MPGKSVLDNYSQGAILESISTATTTGTVITQLVTGLTNIQKLAWAVESVEFSVPAAMIEGLVAYNDYIQIALTQSNNVNQYLDERGQSVIDWLLLGQTVITAGGATAAIYSKGLREIPIIHKFASPRLVLPQNLYLAMKWSLTALGTASRAAAKVMYKEVEVGPEDFYDLLQLRLPLGGV